MSAQDKDSDAELRDDPVIEMIAALARGDAGREEVVASLRRDGLDALDVIVAVLGRAAERSDPRRLAHRPIQLPRPGDGAPRQPGGAHHVPRVPVLLGGTLYDPADINRFDGVELHFVPADDHLIAIEERSVIAQLWQTSYLSAAAEKYKYGGHESGVEPAFTPTPFPPMEPGGELPPSGQGGVGEVPYPHPGAGPETLLFEHMGRTGDYVTLPGNRGFDDLTKVGKGFLGMGDWNDVISSIWMHKTSVCVLHEHIHKEGSSFTVWGGATWVQGHLVEYGWSDRASSVETW